MHDDIVTLKRQLNEISRRIHHTKRLIQREQDSEKKRLLEKELKRLQYQALFYLDKIKNLRGISQRE